VTGRALLEEGGAPRGIADRHLGGGWPLRESARARGEHDQHDRAREKRLVVASVSSSWSGPLKT